MVGAVEHVEPARVARIRVIDGATGLPGEHADAGRLGYRKAADSVVVVRLLPLELLGGDGDVVVGVEVRVEGRHPLDAPAHAPPVGLERRERRARDEDQAGVPMVEVHDDAVEVVHPERAALAALLPARVEHEVLDDELAAPLEEIRERLAAAGAVEHAGLVHLHPGQVPAVLIVSASTSHTRRRTELGES